MRERQIIRTIHCDSWEDLKRQAKYFTSNGYEVIVNGWEQIRDNRLSILGEWDEGEQCYKPMEG